MTAIDESGVPHSYLNTEDSFRWLKELEARNLVVPIAGDFAWGSFCRNVAALPLDDVSVFFRSAFDGRYGHGFGLNSDLGPLLPHLEGCFPAFTR
jgi:hypothetical protein